MNYSVGRGPLGPDSVVLRGGAVSEALGPDDGHRRAVLAGQRRIQRAKLLSGLTKILVGVMICGGLFAAVASGGAFNTATKGASSADSSGAAIGGALTAVAIGILLALWVVLRYRRNLGKATRDYESKQRLSDAGPGDRASGPGSAGANKSLLGKVDHEISDHVSRFVAEGQLSGGPGLRPGPSVPDEDPPSSQPDYSALAEVEYGGQKGTSPDGVNRSGDPRLGTIQ